MRNIIITLFALFVAGCSTAPRPSLNTEQLKTGGYVFATMTIDAGSCDGSLIAKKIESQTPLKIEEKFAGFISFAPNVTLNPLEILQRGYDSKPSFFAAGHYAVTNASCIIRSGNSTMTYSLGHAGSITIATFEVKAGEVVDLGQLKLEADFKWSFLTRKFSHIKSRQIAMNNDKTLEVFRDKNPSYASKITTRHMIPTPVAPRPSEEGQ